MKDADNAERKFGDIELKLLKAKILKEVEKILEQVSNKNENFLYPIMSADRDEYMNIVKIPLIEGEFMGHIYTIHVNGSYPVAYVNLGLCNVGLDVCESIPVHGGCNHAGPMENRDGIWVGWYYDHKGDFDKPRAAAPDTKKPFRKGKKWTVAEVMEDVIRAILYIEENS